MFCWKEHLIQLKRSGWKCAKHYKSVKFCWYWGSRPDLQLKTLAPNFLLMWPCILLSLLFTWKRVHILLWYFNCWFWSKYWLGKGQTSTYILPLFRSSRRRCSMKKAVLISFAIFTGCWSDFFDKVARQKETPAQVFSNEYCETFKNTYFEEQLRTAASVYLFSGGEFFLLVIEFLQQFLNCFCKPISTNYYWFNSLNL